MKQQELEQTIKEMWEARIVNYPLESTKDQAYKHGWEQGFRFASNDQQLTKLFDKIEGMKKDLEKCECSACKYDYDLNCYSATHNQAIDKILKLKEEL